MPRPTKKQEVYKVICESSKDLTSGTVADKVDCTRATAKKWIKDLIKENKVVKTRMIGNMPLYEQRTSHEV